MEESVVFTFPYQINDNHATESSTFGHVISERHRKVTFNLTKIVNKFTVKQRTVCQIVILISHFSVKLCIQFLKGSDYF